MPRHDLVTAIIEANQDAILEQIQRQTEIDENGCWVWQGGTSNSGNPRLYIGTDDDNKPIVAPAPRISYMINRSMDIEHSRVVHTCGNVLCANPDHLRLDVPAILLDV